MRLSEAEAERAEAHQQFFDTQNLSDDLKGKSLRGGFFTMAAEGINFILRIGATAVLARLLVPEQFGLIGMVTALTSIAVNFKDFGLSVATVQRKEINHRQVSTLFWINASAGVLIAALISCLSLPIAWFYKDDRLIWITIALSTSFFWGGLTVQHQAILWRKMQFGALALINLGATVCSILVAIILALKGYGYWALVAREVSSSVFFCIGTVLACGWVPGLPGRVEHLRSMIKMGGDVTAFNLVTFFTDSLDFILVGKLFGAESLGLYRQATQLALLPVGFLTNPVSTVAQPALRVLLSDAPRYRAYYSKILRSLSFVSMPCMVFLYICAPDIVRIVLGEKWLGAVSIFRIFAVAGFIRPVISTAGAVMITCGKTQRYFWIGLANSGGIVVGIIAGLQWGVQGVAVGHVLANYLYFVPVAYIAFRGTPVTLRLFLTSISPSIVCSLLMALILAPFTSRYPMANSYAAVVVYFSVATVVYLASWLAIPRGKGSLTEMSLDVASMFKGKVAASR
jgi:PST family polysaccharide transporter